MQRRFLPCYERWIDGQKSDLSDLLRASTAPGTSTDVQLRSTIEQCMRHYEDYSEQRSVLAREDGPSFFCPPWCTSFENSMLWLGGCRPSLTIRLLYSLTGSEMESHLDEFLQGRLDPTAVGLMGLSANQLQQVNELHQRTVRAEDQLSSRLATLQEDVADRPLLPIVRERQCTCTRTGTGSSAAASSSVTSLLDDGWGFDAGQNGDVDAALQTYADGLAKLVEEADALRLATVKALVTEILSPRQGVELLIAAKQLLLSVHAWAVQRDHHHRRG